MTEEALFEILGPPESEELARVYGKPLDKGLPKHLVKAREWDDWVDEDEEDLRIIDFGEAFLQEAEPKVLPQLGQLQVPEIIFTECFDYTIDLWSAGWDDDILVAQMIGFVEKLPTEWLPKWNCMRLSSQHILEPEESKLEVLMF
ncbi:MAG: hypothetical protein M1834_008916 [Cirrosporium novae-zelandiae]|nr:MAG: hypothetical protein M1834_008916 [Cirrosporium novae-zelandiae]